MTPLFWYPWSVKSSWLEELMMLSWSIFPGNVADDLIFIVDPFKSIYVTKTLHSSTTTL
jgi:hypothetical protein